MQRATPKGDPGRVFKSRLQRILDDEGRRQTWLAKRTGIHPSRINVIVQGLPIDDEDLRAKIADALRRTPEDVFERPIDAPLHGGDSEDLAA